MAVGLEDLNLNGWSLSKLTLSNANFSRSNLTGADFAASNLVGANFNLSTLTKADFADADLRGASDWFDGATENTHDAIRPDGSIQGLSLQRGETLVIRNDSIGVTVDASATFDPAATLQFMLSNNWKSPVSFATGLTPPLDGTLDLDLIAGLNPNRQVGNSWQVFDWSSPLPLNDEFSAITTTPGLVWDTSNLYTTGVVTLVAVPEPASAAILSVAAVGMMLRPKRKQIGAQG
jgi:hypothetical protein